MKVTNWAEYNAGLRRRGSLTLWVTEEAIAAWQAPARLTRGGQSHYSDTAIETNLLIRAVRIPGDRDRSFRNTHEAVRSLLPTRS